MQKKHLSKIQIYQSILMLAVLLIPLSTAAQIPEVVGALNNDSTSSTDATTATKTDTAASNAKKIIEDNEGIVDIIQKSKNEDGTYKIIGKDEKGRTVVLNNVSPTDKKILEDTLDEVAKNASPDLDCNNAVAGAPCKGATSYAQAAGTMVDLTSGYSKAAASRSSAQAYEKFSAAGGTDTIQAEMDAQKLLILEAEQAANRQKVIGGIGGTLATYNVMAAASKNCSLVKDDPKSPQNEQQECMIQKSMNVQAAVQAATAAVPAIQAAIQEKQTENELRAMLEAKQKWLAQGRGTNTVITETPNMPNVWIPPTPPNEEPLVAGYDSNLLGHGAGTTPPGALPAGDGSYAWMANGALGGGSGTGPSGASAPNGTSDPSMASAPMDPNAGKPSYANVDETGGYVGGTNGNAGRLDMNNPLAQFLPRMGGDNKAAAENGVLGSPKERGLASQNTSLLGPDADLFGNITSAYKRKEKAGAIKL